MEYTRIPLNMVNGMMIRRCNWGYPIFLPKPNRFLSPAVHPDQGELLHGVGVRRDRGFCGVVCCKLTSCILCCETLGSHQHLTREGSKAVISTFWGLWTLFASYSYFDVHHEFQAEEKDETIPKWVTWKQYGQDMLCSQITVTQGSEPSSFLLGGANFHCTYCTSILG